MTDDALKLHGQITRTRRSLGVQNRQPMGQLTMATIADTVYFDTATASVTGLYIPDRALLMVECRVAIDFDQYPMPVSDAASGGGSTSGASDTSSSSSSPHNHLWGTVTGGAHGGKASKEFVINGAFFDLTTDATPVIGTANDSPAHDHEIPHHHSTPNHVHSLTAASTKEAYPGSHSVTLKVYELVDTTWTLRGTISGITEDAPDLDLRSYVVGPGRWRIQLQSAGGQPNGGRLGAHLSGYALVAIQSS